MKLVENPTITNYPEIYTNDVAPRVVDRKSSKQRGIFRRIRDIFGV